MGKIYQVQNTTEYNIAGVLWYFMGCTQKAYELLLAYKHIILGPFHGIICMHYLCYITVTQKRYIIYGNYNAIMTLFMYDPIWNNIITETKLPNLIYQNTRDENF